MDPIWWIGAILDAKTLAMAHNYVVNTVLRFGGRVMTLVRYTQIDFIHIPTINDLISILQLPSSLKCL